jgi:LPS-assembly lipoprotein
LFLIVLSTLWLVDKPLKAVWFIIYLLLGMGLSACGYKPLYESAGDGRGVVAQLSGIAIQEPESRAGQLVRNNLLSSMRPAGTAHDDRFTLILTPEIAQSTLVDQARPGIQRERLRLNVAYRLVNVATGKDVKSGKTFSTVSYDIVHEPVADLQAEANALNRAAQEVGGDIHTRLAAFMASRAS